MEQPRGRVAGKTALVTGAAQGLGAAIAKRLAQEGADVIVSDHNAEGAAAVAQAINAQAGGETATAIHLDVTSEADWAAAVAHARERFGGLSILVNNAGIVTIGSIETLSLDEWRKAMSVNADSVFLGCKAALPLMGEAQPASIINISSISAMIAGHNMPAYNASKAAVWMLTKSVALHCAREKLDIRCNSVHPTFVRTALLDGIVGDSDNAEALAKLARQVPLGRIGEAEDVADAVLYLASEESRMMTGSEIKLDGGLSAM
ncbi:short-chain dehydrogenase [Sphingobium sp. C100]|uniref:SDR family oxidoreductase n=1 Tax=Sphingobium sp. C100 TaxID=1207055 RepID=UPI0003D5CE91|nr:SDR family oxidoreductase [Sphingobium sp. C100]ETI61186.1 short-chain dehydrogenase [Sphingobium sp. C100]